MYVHTHKRPSRLTHTNLQTRSSLAKAIIFQGGESILALARGWQSGFWCRSMAVPSLDVPVYLHLQQCPLPPRKASCPNLLCALLTAPLGTQWDFEIFKQQPSLLQCLSNSALLKRVIQVAPKITLSGRCHFSAAVLTMVQMPIPSVQEMPPAFVLLVGTSAEIYTETCTGKMYSDCKI